MPIRAEGQDVEFMCMSGECERITILADRVHVPQAYSFIVAAGSQPAPVRAEGQSIDLLLMPGHRKPIRLLKCSTQSFFRRSQAWFAGLPNRIRLLCQQN